eukprot:tig00001336_g8225.t1
MAELQISRGTDPLPCVRAHRVPCIIKHDGPASVSTFFLLEQGEGASGIIDAEFRGRQLRGRQLQLPSSYAGVLLDVRRSEGSEGSSQSEAPASCSDVRVAARLSSISWYTHDIEPNESDPTPRALEWIDMARAVHGAVSPSAVDRMAKAIQDSGDGPQPKRPRTATDST